jgi:hypothetical protein
VELQTPAEVAGEYEALYYELKLQLIKDGCASETVTTLSGSLMLNSTTNRDLLANSNPEVVVFSTIQKASEMDNEITQLLIQGKATEAKAKQTQQIEMLQKTLPLDQHGVLDSLLKMAEKALKKIEQEGTSASVQQEYSHQSYMKRRGSFCYIDHYA